MAELIVIIPMVLFSMIIHEIAHAWMALRCGDPTARDAGRITLNPIPHIDLFMTVLVPLFFIFNYLRGGPLFIIGGAKPVPVNPYLLRGGEKDNVKVSFAGPGSNIALALLAFAVSLILSVIFRLTATPLAVFFIGLLNIFILLNLILANFNLLPVPPLDGSWILAYFLRGEAKRAYQNLRRGGFLIFILFLLVAQRIPIGNGDLLDLLFTPTYKLLALFRDIQALVLR
jgi:Zn-dependent protease